MVKYALVNTAQRWYAQDFGAAPPGGDDVGFHNVLFPEGVQYGTQGGPGWRTTIVPLDSGGEERISRWPESRRTYDAVHNIKTRDDLSQILTFYEARHGAAYGFRFKDWNDFTTASNHRSAPTEDDVLIGVGDGVTRSFQLVKHYQTAGSDGVFTRVIKLPCIPEYWTHTPLAKVGATSKTYGTDFTVNDTTGEILFADIPAEGANITAGFYFHVPVRFGESADENLRVSIDAFDSGSLPEVPLVEIVDNILWDEDFNYGYGSEISYSIPFQISHSMGRCIRWTDSTASTTAYLETPTTLPSGGPHFYLWNNTGHTLTLATKTASVGSLTSQEHGVLYIFKVGGVNTWKLLK